MSVNVEMDIFTLTVMDLSKCMQNVAPLQLVFFNTLTLAAAI